MMTEANLKKEQTRLKKEIEMITEEDKIKKIQIFIMGLSNNKKKKDN